MNHADQPRRFVITAGFLTESPLAIHSGFSSEDLAALGQSTFPGGASPPEKCDQLVMRDGHGLPYIPGSSLKGVLREFTGRGGFDAATVDPLLGTATTPGADNDERGGSGGTAVFEDAFLDVGGACLTPEHATWLADLRRGGESLVRVLDEKCFAENSWRDSRQALALLTNADHLPNWDATRLTYVEQMTAVNRRTGTVDEHKLFNCEVVPAGLPFVVSLIVDDFNGTGLAGVQILLRALAGFNLDPVYRPPQLGSGTHYGWGRMVCLFSTVRVQSWTPQGMVPVGSGELDVAKELQAGLKEPPLARWTRVQFNLKLSFQGPFLVNDNSQVAVQHGVTDPGQPLENKPDHVPRIARLVTSGGKSGQIRALPLLPSTGCKGPLRSRLELILRTLHGDRIQVSPHGQLDPVTRDSQSFVQRLFGLDSQQSGLWCSEFVGDQELPFLLREMVAIDRFTGSVAGSAKFNAVCFDRPVLTGAVVFELPAEEHDAQRILGGMALLLRELCEGDVSFGWGDMKFFGQCTARIEGLAIHAACHQPSLLQRLRDKLALALPAANPHSIDRELTAWANQVRELVVLNQVQDERVAAADHIADDFLAAVRQAISPATVEA